MADERRRDSSLTISGLQYHVNEWDGGGDTTVLLLHGYLDLGQNWSFLAEALEDTDWHIVAPDWRGHGDSDWIGAGGYYHFADYVRDLEQLVTALRRRRLIVVGHSMGAMVATLWAGLRTEHLNGLVLVDGTGPMMIGTDDYPRRFQAWLEQTAPYQPKDFSRPMADLAHATRRLERAFPKLSGHMVARIAQFSTCADVEGGRRWKYDPLHRTQAPMPMLPAIVEGFWRKIQCPIFG